MASGDKVVIASKEYVANSILDNIVDDINTDDSTKSVSAKQVKILNDRTIKNDEDGVINGSLTVIEDDDRQVDIYNSSLRLWANKSANDDSTRFLNINMFDDGTAFALTLKDKDSNVLEAITIADDHSFTYNDRKLVDSYGSTGEYASMDLYVDYANGDDSGPGSIDEPFKTIARAAKTTLYSGGRFNIYLDNVTEHVLPDEDINIYATNVHFVLWDNADDESNYKIKVSVYDDGDYSFFRKFYVSRGGSLRFYYCTFTGLSRSNDLSFKIDDYGSAFITCNEFLTVYLDHCVVDMSDCINASIVLITRYYIVGTSINVYKSDITLGNDSSISLVNNRTNTPFVYQRLFSTLDYRYNDNTNREIRHLTYGNKNVQTNVPDLYTIGRITIDDDSVGIIKLPTSNGTYRLIVGSYEYPHGKFQGILFTDTGASSFICAVNISPDNSDYIETYYDTDLDGTTSEDGHIGLAVNDDVDELQIENRIGGAYYFALEPIEVRYS
jgi:hypothetical protein